MLWHGVSWTIYVNPSQEWEREREKENEGEKESERDLNVGKQRSITLCNNWSKYNSLPTTVISCLSFYNFMQCFGMQF